MAPVVRIKRSLPVPPFLGVLTLLTKRVISLKLRKLLEGESNEIFQYLFCIYFLLCYVAILLIWLTTYFANFITFQAYNVQRIVQGAVEQM